MSVVKGAIQSEANPGTGGYGALNSEEPNKVIRFISLNAESGSDDFNVIKDIIQTRGYAVDFVEFKFSTTKIQRRLIKPTQKDGPKERIEIEEKIDVNSSYKHLRHLSARVQKEVNNVLLVQVNQIKGFPCSAPILFPELLKSKRPILVNGVTDRIHVQLISKPDLNFRIVDAPIARNPFLRRKILERAERSKSMQAIGRELKDFFGLPSHIREKLNELAVGNKVPLSDEEAINIILISDLYTRYLPLFQNFERDIANRNQTVAALASQFVDMTRGIRTEHLLEAFKNFLIEEDSDGEAFASENNTQLFSYFYKRAQLLEEKRLRVGDHPVTRADMFATLRSLITLARSQIDPGLWKQCRFFFKHGDLKTSKKGNIQTIDALIDETYSKLKVYHSASSLSLLEIYLIHNLHRLITGRKVLVTQSDLSKIESDLIRSVVIPILYQQDSIPSKETIRLMLGMQANLQTLINPVHTVGRVYSFLMGRRLRENVQKFLRPGLRDLLARFGKNFFIIFYELAVQEPGLLISRNQFAEWLQEKDYFKKPQDYGYIRNSLENHYDPNLSAKNLMETGESCFPETYSEKDFTTDLEAARKIFGEFITNMQNDGRGFAKLLSDFLSSGKYDLKSADFREFVKKSKYYKLFGALVFKACKEIAPRLKTLAVNNKMVLKVPIEIEPLLLLENIFNLPSGEETIQIHLIAVPVKSEKELEPASKVFSKNLIQSLKRGSDPTLKELNRANRMLRIYQDTYSEYVRFLLISILDRQINNSILKIRQQKNQTPNHIRNHFENFEKLFIGTIKSQYLNKLVRFDPTNKTKDVVYNLSVAQVLQAIVLYKSATHKLRDYRLIIEEIKSLLENISKTKDDYEKLTYLKQINKFQEMISTPIEDLNENVLNLITTLAKKIQKTVEQSRENKGILIRIFEKWKKQDLNAEDKCGFFKPFLKPDGYGYEQKLFLEIAKSREILLNIKRRKCLVFFPETLQEDQFELMLEVGSFIIERDFDATLFVEISGMNKQQIESLSKVFYPGNFFRLDRVKPVK